MAKDRDRMVIYDDPPDRCIVKFSYPMNREHATNIRNAIRESFMNTMRLPTEVTNIFFEPSVAIDQVFSVLIDTQLAVNANDPEAFEPTDENVTSWLYAICEEIHEAGRELVWKPWKSDKSAMSDQRFVEEMADVLAFVGNLMVTAANRLEVDPKELGRRIAREYVAVSMRNAEKLDREAKLRG